MAEEITPTAAEEHGPFEALQAAVNDALGNKELDRAAKFAAIQPALEEVAESIKTQVEASTPVDVGTELSNALAPLVNKIELLVAKLDRPTAPQQLQQPVQRSMQPSAPARTQGEPTMHNPTPQLRSLVRASTGIVE